MNRTIANVFLLFSLNILLELHHQFALGTHTDTLRAGLISKRTNTSNVVHHPAEDSSIQELVIDDQKLACSRRELAL